MKACGGDAAVAERGHRAVWEVWPPTEGVFRRAALSHVIVSLVDVLESPRALHAPHKRIRPACGREVEWVPVRPGR